MLSIVHLSLLQLLVQLLLQVDHIQACGGRAGHILHPQLPLLCPFPAAQQIVFLWYRQHSTLHSYAVRCISRTAARVKQHPPGWQDGVEDVFCWCDASPLLNWWQGSLMQHQLW